MCGFEGMYHKPQKLNKEINKYLKCASGSVVEYRLAKARVAGSNPVSCFSEGALPHRYVIIYGAALYFYVQT